jgi:hypothetical protein
MATNTAATSMSYSAVMCAVRKRSPVTLCRPLRRALRCSPGQQRWAERAAGQPWQSMRAVGADGG